MEAAVNMETVAVPTGLPKVDGHVQLKAKPLRPPDRLRYAPTGESDFRADTGLSLAHSWRAASGLENAYFKVTCGQERVRIGPPTYTAAGARFSGGSWEGVERFEIDPPLPSGVGTRWRFTPLGRPVVPDE